MAQSNFPALTVQQVQTAYLAFFNRPADSAGLAYWTSVQHKGGLPGMWSSFGLVPEFTTTFGNKPATEIVETFYVNMFGRSSDAAGKAYWLAQLSAGRVDIGNLAAAFDAGAAPADKTILSGKVVANTATTQAAIDAALPGTTFQLTASTTNPDDITGTGRSDTFNASPGRLQDNDVINGLGGIDTLNASLAASGDAFLTSVEILNITAINANASMEGDKITGATNLNVLGGGTLTYTAAAAGLAYSVAGDDTTLTMTQAGADSGTDSVRVELKAGKLGTLTLGSAAAGVDFETFNLNVNGATSATLTEAGTANFAQTTDKITVTGSGTFALTIDAGAMGEHASAGVATVVDASGHNGVFKMDLTTLDTTLKVVTAVGYAGVDQIQVGLAVDGHIVQKVASGTEVIVDTAETDGTSTLTITERASAVNDQLTVTFNHGTAGLAIDVVSLTLDGFESATINSTGTDSATVVVANNIDTIAGTANDKNLTITGNKKLTAGVEATYTNIVSTNTAGVDLTVAAGTDIKFVGGAGNDRLEMDTVADITAADNLDGGTGKNTLAISATIGTDFSTAQLAVIKNFQVLEYKGAQDIKAATAAQAIDLTKLTTINELFINGVLTTDTGPLSLTVKADDGFVLRMGAHGLDGGAASQLDVQITNALSAGTNNTVTLQLVDIVDDGTTSTATNGGLKIAGVEKLNIALLGNETVPATGTTTAADTYTLSDIDGVVLQDIVIRSANTGRATDGTALASDSLTISGVESTLVRTVDASAFTGALNIAGMAGNFIATGATITGGSGVNTITGGTGADTITTGRGNDLVLGGTGADVISTGAGADVVLAATDADSTPEARSTVVGGTAATGDFATITVFGKAISGAAQLTASPTHSLAGIAANLKTAIEADADISKLVSVVISETTAAGDTVTVTSKVDGNFTDFAFTKTGTATVSSITAADGTNSTDADTVNLGAGADFVHAGGGKNVIDLGANDLAADTVYILGVHETENTIRNFEAGTTGSDVIKFAGNIVNNGTDTDTLVTITKTGATAEDRVFFKVSDATAAGGANTAAKIVTHLAGVTLTGIASGDDIIFAVNDGADMYLWMFTEDGTAGIQAGNLALVATLVGVTDIANGDLVQID